MVPPARWPPENASALAIFHVTLSPHSYFWNDPSLQPAAILDWPGPSRYSTSTTRKNTGLPDLQTHIAQIAKFANTPHWSGIQIKATKRISRMPSIYINLPNFCPSQIAINYKL